MINLKKKIEINSLTDCFNDSYFKLIKWGRVTKRKKLKKIISVFGLFLFYFYYLLYFFFSLNTPESPQRFFEIQSTKIKNDFNSEKSERNIK